MYFPDIHYITIQTFPLFSSRKRDIFILSVSFFIPGYDWVKGITQKYKWDGRKFREGIAILRKTMYFFIFAREIGIYR